MRPVGGLAAVTTITAMVMAGVAAWDRGGTTLDRALLMAVAVVVCTSTHVLPAFSRRGVTWIVWIGCLLATVYGHVTFFTHAGIRAGEGRANASAQVVGTAEQMQAAREALAGITARPIAVVASDLAEATDRKHRQALAAELTEAKRAAALNDELVRLAGVTTQAEVAGATDPVTARLAVVTGRSEASIALGIGFLLSVLLELTGALLWFEAVKPVAAVEEPAPVVEEEESPIARVKAAIEAGECKPTVAAIRQYLGCSQAAAMDVRRAVSS